MIEPPNPALTGGVFVYRLARGNGLRLAAIFFDAIVLVRAECKRLTNPTLCFIGVAI